MAIIYFVYHKSIVLFTSFQNPEINCQLLIWEKIRFNLLTL